MIAIAPKTIYKKRKPQPAYRTTLQEAKGLLKQVRSSLLLALILYKLLTVVVFIPLLQRVWALALWLSPTKYITTDNLTRLFASPAILAAILIIAVATAWWALLEFSLIVCGLDDSQKGLACDLVPLLVRSAKSIRHAFLPKNWGILLYAAVLIPFTNLFLNSTYISQLIVPEYIAEVIRANPLWHAAYFAVLVPLYALSVCGVLSLHYFILQHRSFRSAFAASFAWIREKPVQKLYMLVRWSIRRSGGLLIFTLPFVIGFFVLLGAVGLFSDILMLSLWRSFLLFLGPFITYMLDCLLTLMVNAFLSTVYYQQNPVAAPEVPHSPARKRGRIRLAGVCGCMVALWLAAGVITAASPELNALFAARFFPTATVTSHRGYSAVAPENTLPAFEAAIEVGADCAELDVQMTKDGVVMLTHDTNLARTTGKNANIYDLTYEEVKALDAGSFFSPEFAGTQIPTLQEVMDLCKGRIRLNIEIKPSEESPELEAETARLITENGLENDCVVTSLSYDSLVKVKQAAPQVKCGYIMAVGVGNYYDLPAADFFSVESTFITSGMLQQLHARGKTVSAWTIDQERDAQKMKDLGVDDMITGDPPMVKQVLQQNSEGENGLETVRGMLLALFPSRDDDPFESIQAMLQNF